MGYYDNGTHAERNGYKVITAEYNRMQMQAEMTANALARHNSNIDINAFIQANADSMCNAVSKALQDDRRAREQAEREAEREQRRIARERRVTNMQGNSGVILDKLINDEKAVPANLPTSYEDAVAACNYIRKANTYLTPWDRPNLTRNYRNLLQALLNRASAATIESLTRCCVNDWKNELSFLKTKANYHSDIDTWEDDYKQLVVR